MIRSRRFIVGAVLLVPMFFVMPQTRAQEDESKGRDGRMRRLTLRIRIETFDGVFLVYDARVMMSGVDKSAAYFATWYDVIESELFVYGRLLGSELDLGHALIAIEETFGDVAAPLIDFAPALQGFYDGAQPQDRDATLWHPADREVMLELLNESSAIAASDHNGPAPVCDPAACTDSVNPGPGPPGMSIPPAPPRGMSPFELIDVVLASGCCGGGGGGCCGGGSCIPCCLASSAAAGGGVCCPPGVVTCNDGNPCTTNDRCCSDTPKPQSCPPDDDPFPELCGGDIISCPSDGNPCTVNRCDNGACTSTPRVCQSDNNSCTDDVCISGVGCVNTCTAACSCDGTCCSNGQQCCGTSCCIASLCCFGQDCCSPSQDCCDNGECCDQPCDACTNNGMLSGGTIDAVPNPACINDTITFTVMGVTDSGGTKLENCAPMTISPVPPSYTWMITKPDGATVSGAGSTATVVADLPGSYSCTFTAKAQRECPPPDLDIGPEIATACKLTVGEVTFSGSGMHMVAHDDGSGDYGTPHWRDLSNPTDGDNEDVGDHNYPILYVQGTLMQLSAKFVLNPPTAFSGAIEVTGVASGGGAQYTFVSTGTVSNGELIITNVPADKVLTAGKVDFFDPLTIDWSFAAGGQPLDCDVADTKHRVYVSLGTPVVGITMFETTVHLGVKNAVGSTTEAAVISGVWNEFTDRVVQRKPKDGFNNPDGQQLTYYQTWTCANLTTAALLANDDGQCGAWAKFFLDQLGVHGINHLNEYILFRDSRPGSNRGFIVKDWTFSAGTGVSGVADYPFLNLPGNPLIAATSYQWLFAEVTDGMGVPGQGTANPASFFQNHQVVKLTGTYYDPSYGNSYATLADIENGAIEGYWRNIAILVDEPVVGLDLNNDGDMLDLQQAAAVFVFQKNPVGNQLQEIKIDYPFP